MMDPEKDENEATPEATDGESAEQAEGKVSDGDLDNAAGGVYQ